MTWIQKATRNVQKMKNMILCPIYQNWKKNEEKNQLTRMMIRSGKYSEKKFWNSIQLHSQIPFYSILFNSIFIFFEFKIQESNYFFSSYLYKLGTKNSLLFIVRIFFPLFAGNLFGWIEKKNLNFRPTGKFVYFYRKKIIIIIIILHTHSDFLQVKTFFVCVGGWMPVIGYFFPFLLKNNHTPLTHSTSHNKFHFNSAANSD